MHTVQWQNAVIQQSIASKRRFPRLQNSIGLIAEYSLSRIARFRLAILCSAVAEQRHMIIRKRVALRHDENVSVVTVGTAPAQTGDPTHAHLHHWQ
jgi:hypothetical protein